MGNKEGNDKPDIIVYRYSPSNVFVYDPSIQPKSSPHQYFDVCETRMRGFDPNYIRRFPVITDPKDRDLAIKLYERWSDMLFFASKPIDAKRLILEKEPITQTRTYPQTKPVKEFFPKAETKAETTSLTKSSLPTEEIDVSKALENHILEVCDNFGIAYFYHITGVPNLSKVLTQGLLCFNRADTTYDISDPEIQSHRHLKQNPIYPHLTMHDCVPLFVAPKPPMLSARREQQPDICYLCIDPMVLSLPEVTFSDGNARSNTTRIYKDLKDLARLDWDVLTAKYWNHDDPEIHSENKRKRSAEILVPFQIPVSFIQKIIVMNHRAYNNVLALMKEISQRIPVQINTDMYFGMTGNYQDSDTQYFPPPIGLEGIDSIPEPPPNFEWDDPLLND